MIIVTTVVAATTSFATRLATAGQGGPRLLVAATGGLNIVVLLLAAAAGLTFGVLIRRLIASRGRAKSERARTAKQAERQARTPAKKKTPRKR